MVPLDINPEGEKEGIISSQPQASNSNKSIEGKKIISTSLGLLLIVAVIAAAIFVINNVQKYRVKSYDKKIGVQNSEILNMGDLQVKAEAIFGQVQNLQNLWDSRTLWSNVMKEFDSTMIANNKVDAMSVDSGGKLHIKGTSNSLNTLAKLLSSFENNSKFSNVSLISANVVSNSVNFDIEMNFSPSLLEAKK